MPIDGSATLTIEASRTTTNCASASSASASHFLSCGKLWGDTGKTPGNGELTQVTGTGVPVSIGTIRNFDSGFKWGYPHLMTILETGSIPAESPSPSARCGPTRGATASGSSRPRAPSSPSRAIEAADRRRGEDARRSASAPSTATSRPRRRSRDALVRERFEEIAGYAREALEREDAWEGFCELIWRAADAQRRRPRALRGRSRSPTRARSSRRPAWPASTDTLMARAKAQGADARRRDRGRRADDDVRRRAP